MHGQHFNLQCHAFWVVIVPMEMSAEKKRTHAIKQNLDAMALCLYATATQAGKLSLEMQALEAGKSTSDLVKIADWAVAEADSLKARAQAIAEAVL